MCLVLEKNILNSLFRLSQHSTVTPIFLHQQLVGQQKLYKLCFHRTLKKQDMFHYYHNFNTGYTDTFKQNNVTTNIDHRTHNNVFLNDCMRV